MKKPNLALLFVILFCAVVISAQATTIDVNSPFSFTGIYAVRTWWGAGGGGGGGGGSAASIIVQNTAGTPTSFIDGGTLRTIGGLAGFGGVANGQPFSVPPMDNGTLGTLGGLAGSGVANGHPFTIPPMDNVALGTFGGLAGSGVANGHPFTIPPMDIGTLGTLGSVTGFGGVTSGQSFGPGILALATPIPEPASLLLLGTSLGGLALAAWRRKK